MTDGSGDDGEEIYDFGIGVQHVMPFDKRRPNAGKDRMAFADLRATGDALRAANDRLDHVDTPTFPFTHRET